MVVPRLAMQIELTNHCNFKCVYCPHSVYGEDAGPSGNPFNRPKGYMSGALYERAIAGAHDYANSLTMGFFGEQQLHPKFEEWMRAMTPRKQRQFVFYLNTNWSRVTQENVDSLMCVDTVRISIDSTKAAMWEELCPGGPVLNEDGTKGASRFQALIDKIKWWLKLPKRPKTLLVFVTQTANKPEIEAFGKAWQPLMRGGDKATAKSILTYGGVMLDEHMVKRPCPVAEQNRFTIAWDGRCTPCNLDVNLGMAVSNLNTHTIPEIVNSPEWAGKLAGIRKRVGVCANCFDAQNHSQKMFGPKSA